MAGQSKIEREAAAGWVNQAGRAEHTPGVIARCDSEGRTDSLGRGRDSDRKWLPREGGSEAFTRKPETGHSGRILADIGSAQLPPGAGMPSLARSGWRSATREYTVRSFDGRNCTAPVESVS